MAESDDTIARLQARLDNLVRTQISFQQEITQIRNELNQLRTIQNQNIPQTPPSAKPPVRDFGPPPETTQSSGMPQSARSTEPPDFGYQQTSQPPFETDAQPAHPREKSEIEKFIGENLISKIGIVILVIGVAIGAKYAIDNNLISPATRIFLGYLGGFGLLGLALKLKAKYLDFSAVLLSGAMAIMYFITYFAHSLYGLFAQPAAFVLMIIFTVFTVAAAIIYNRQIIAHFGLVGAYAVPFLLSEDTGRYAFLFTYIAIINGGILAVSLRRYWKPLFYTSFVLTWIIFIGWYETAYNPGNHFNLALLFISVYFLIFYLTFIAYKVISDENLAIENVGLILSNSFIFYGLGISILDSRAGLESYLGLFTVANAAIHFVFAVTVSRLKIFPTDLIYLMTALIITFATISIPVQLDGNWVTLIWTAEAAILFSIGRRKQISLFQYFSFPLMFLAAVSLFQDWVLIEARRNLDEIGAGQFPLLNANFLTSLLFAGAFGFIFYTNKDERYETAFHENLRKPFGYLVAGVGLAVLYNCFRLEIANYFHYQIVKTAIPQTVPPNGTVLKNTNYDLELFSSVWQINYTMLFLAVLSCINIVKFKNIVLAAANLLLNAFILFIFVTGGLYFLSELRGNFLVENESQLFARNSYNIFIRYIAYAFCAGLIFACYRYIKQKFLLDRVSSTLLNPAFDFIFYGSLLIISSSELINLMDIFGFRDSYKLGLSILWGIYALILIIIGIYAHKKHLRIGAIALLGLTLAKLFFYDIADLDTISKTVVFVSLGVLMLIVSFLYNKYKSLIFETNEN